MRLLLINPRNPLVNITNKNNIWNKYRVWKPLGLLVLAGLTPSEWDITVVDENVCLPDYSQMPPPDLVGVTAFTSQAPRAYEVAAEFRSRGVLVAMGGIHATMRQEEAAKRVDIVVTGEAEGVWAHVLKDAARGALKPFVCRRQRSNGEDAGGPPRSSAKRLSVRSHSNHARVSAQLQFLQCQLIQRKGVPAASCRRCYCRVQADKRETRTHRG